MSESIPSTEMRRWFGRWLKEQRKTHGITQEFVAEKSDITVAQLSRIENGKSGTRRDTVILLARIIGINEAEALRHFAPERFPQFPEELENIPFSEFTKQELKEIADFINFKLAQKRARQSQTRLKIEEEPSAIKLKIDKKANQKEPEIHLETPSQEDTGGTMSYWIDNGRLISDTEDEENGHTTQKPAE